MCAFTVSNELWSLKVVKNKKNYPTGRVQRGRQRLLVCTQLPRPIKAERRAASRKELSKALLYQYV